MVILVKNDKLNIQFSIFLFIVYIIFILINDYFCFIFNFKANFITYLISGAIVSICIFFSRKKINLIKEKFDKIDIAFFLMLFIILGLRIFIPDFAFDTYNYHLYLQENLFANNTSYNFFPARWINSFSFPLADRMHYFFRYFLGYRLGLILNFLTLMVVYYQLKRILTKFTSKQYIICISSIFIIFTDQILKNMITYYVDLISIPIILEIVYVLFDKKVDQKTNYFILLLAGILVSLKVSNAFFLIPLAIIYIIKNKKSINYKTFLIGIPIFLFPFVIYVTNNYLQTGNPVFPFYNSIFKSEYLLTTNWVEEFYGPKSLIERIVWPVYTILSPRRTMDHALYYGTIYFGFVASLLIIILAFINKYRKKEKFDIGFYLAIIFFIEQLLWSNFMMGYIRYALWLEILSGILIVYFILKNFNKGLSIKVLVFFLSFTMILSSVATFIGLIKSNAENSWRLSIFTNFPQHLKNAPYLFSGGWDYSHVLDGVDCIGITTYNSGYASIITDDIPIIGLNESFQNQYGKQQLDKLVGSCKNIYTITTTTSYEKTQEYLKVLDYEQVGEERRTKAEFINIEDDLILFEIKKTN